MQKGVQLMPPRHSSADILVVYLLFCLHLCIAKGTAAKADSIQRGFVHQWWRHERSMGCCHTIGDQMFVYYVPLGSITRHLRMPNTRVQSVWSWQTERKVLVVPFDNFDRESYQPSVKFYNQSWEFETKKTLGCDITTVMSIGAREIRQSLIYPVTLQ